MQIWYTKLDKVISFYNAHVLNFVWKKKFEYEDSTT